MPKETLYVVEFIRKRVGTIKQAASWTGTPVDKLEAALNERGYFQNESWHVTEEYKPEDDD